MKVYLLTALLIGICFLNSCMLTKRVTNHSFIRSDEKILIRRDFTKYFSNCQVEGSTVIYDNTNKTWVCSDMEDAKTENLPASTFKIVNLLIALETETIKDENDIIKWPGQTDTVKYGY